jgi:hypothetical protein
MNRDDIEKLMGGYAAGTLTEDERQALFAAALEDQQLFESLAAEEPLRELLQDPAAKAQLLAALDNRPAPWYRRLVRPAFGTAAAAAMVLLAVLARREPPKPAPEPVVVAQTGREPVRSFQPPLPVEKSPLPRVLPKPAALPPPPELPALKPPAAATPPLDKIAPAAPAPPAPSQNAAEQLSAAAAEPQPAAAAAPMARIQTFRALNLVTAKEDAASAARLGLRYAVYKKSPAGDLTEVDPETELERNDEVVIRFESTQGGFLSVSQVDAPNALHVIASKQLVPSTPFTVPSTGILRPNGAGVSEFRVVFSPLPQAAKKFIPGTAGADAGPTQATFHITLKYK